MHISVFFDNFVAAEIEPLAKLCDMAVSMAFNLLGWATGKAAADFEITERIRLGRLERRKKPLERLRKASSDKENPFGSIAKVLGLKISLEDARLGKIYM